MNRIRGTGRRERRIIIGLLGADSMNPPARMWNSKVKHGSKLSLEPILFDNCQEWEVLPHKKSFVTEAPRGISVSVSLDGHVSFSPKATGCFPMSYGPKDFSAPIGMGRATAPFILRRFFRELKRFAVVGLVACCGYANHALGCTER